MISTGIITLPFLLFCQQCLGMPLPQSRSLASDAAWYRGGGRTREGSWYKGGRNSHLGRWISGGRGQVGEEEEVEDKVEKVGSEEEEEVEDKVEEVGSEEEEEGEAFERLTKVDEDVWERNELFYDLKNIKIGVWYQWNQGRLQIINDRNTTEPLNQKLKTEGLIDDLDDLGS